MRLSIIIPCYNMGKYLQRCLQSIVGENLSEYEVICVNDGSKDDTIEIFNQFKYDADRRDLYPFVRIVNQENQGVSVARNAGIEMAHGDYISFVDPDDMIAPGGLNALLETAENNNNPDWVIGGFRRVRESSDHIDSIPDAMCFCGDEAPVICDSKLYVFFCGAPWAKLYSRDVIMKNNLRFTVGMVRSQDSEFNTRFIREIQSFATCPVVTYLYLENNDGAMASFKRRAEIDAKKLFLSSFIQTRSMIYPEGESRDEALKEAIKISSFVWLSTIYILYRSKCENKYHWLKEIKKAAEEINPDWINDFKTGNPRIVRLSMKLGLRTTHLMMKFISLFPFIRKRIRG